MLRELCVQDSRRCRRRARCGSRCRRCGPCPCRRRWAGARWSCPPASAVDPQTAPVNTASGGPGTQRTIHGRGEQRREGAQNDQQYSGQTSRKFIPINIISLFAIFVPLACVRLCFSVAAVMVPRLDTTTDDAAVMVPRLDTTTDDDALLIYCQDICILQHNNAHLRTFQQQPLAWNKAMSWKLP